MRRRDAVAEDVGAPAGEVCWPSYPVRDAVGRDYLLGHVVRQQYDGEMELAVLTRSDGVFALDPHGVDADALVDLRDARSGPGQQVRRQGRVVGDMHHDCRFALAVVAIGSSLALARPPTVARAHHQSRRRLSSCLVIALPPSRPEAGKPIEKGQGTGKMAAAQVTDAYCLNGSGDQPAPRVGHGDERAFEQLVPMVHAELRRIARRQMGHERVGPYLAAHRARQRGLPQADRHPAGAVAGPRALLRHVLAGDAARAGGLRARARIPEAWGRCAAGHVGRRTRGHCGAAADVLALDDALDALAAIDPRKGQVVEMRYFGGLSIEETAEALGVSVRTVKRDWTMAKLWLRRALKKA